MALSLWTLAILSIAGTSLWVVLHVRAMIALGRFPSLAGPQPSEPAQWPKLSVVVAACDEESTIEGTAESLLGQDYPDLEIIIVDDRSRDGTRAVLDRVAARAPRLRVVYVDELPAGWLGKVHALHRGTEAASGEWLLYCDADVVLERDCLRRAVALASARELDHMPVLPHMPTRSTLLEATYCAFGTAYLAALRATKLAEPSSDAYAGVGAFDLVRAELLGRAGGFSELRMEVADDVGIGFLVKSAGGRTGLALGGGALEVEWYGSVGDMACGLEKNLFGIIGHYRLWRALVRTAAFGGVSLAPIVALLMPPATGGWIAAAVAAVVLVANSWVVKRRLGQRAIGGLLEMLGVAFLCYMALRSALATLRRGGIRWRGTFYSLEELRAGQRVKI